MTVDCMNNSYAEVEVEIVDSYHGSDGEMERVDLDDSDAKVRVVELDDSLTDII